MNIVSLNINGIRSGISKGFFEYLKEKSPHIICLQEIKAMENQIPLMEFESLGYHTHWFPAQKKGYSGTAILSTITPLDIVKGMGIPDYDNEGRCIRMDFGDFTILSVYHPSGSSGDTRQEFKMRWFEDFDKHIKELQKTRKKLIISGDFNVCHREIDIHDPVRNKNVSGFLPEERQWFDNFLNMGFIDSYRHVNKEPHHYSWWSFRANAKEKNLGWRIDYNLVSDNLKQFISHAYMDNMVCFSDHCPVWLTMKIEL